MKEVASAAPALKKTLRSRVRVVGGRVLVGARTGGIVGKASMYLSKVSGKSGVKTALRRADPERHSQKVKCGPLEVDFESYKAWLKGELMDLTPKQFELLGLFLKNEGKVLTRTRISIALWGEDLSGFSRSMNTTVDQIRQKLGKNRHWIKSLKGIGYRFEIDD